MQNSAKLDDGHGQLASARSTSSAQFEELLRLAGAMQPATGQFPAKESFAPERHESTPAIAPARFYAETGKRLFDIALVLVTLPITAVIICVFAIALLIEGGNPFYRQDRVGRGGRVFRMYKLRTMARDAEERLDTLLSGNAVLRAEWHFTQKLKVDPRVTPVGDFLRRASIDELPQIWNILIGDMSIVGPRPMMPDQIGIYGDPEAYYALRPGLTGFWQVRERNDSHFAFRAEVDRDYRSRLSFWVDMGVIWRTVGVVLRRTGY